MQLALTALLVSALVTPIGPTERVSVFVELAETAAVDAHDAGAARSARERTGASASRVASAARAQEVARTSNAVPGVVLNADSSRLATLVRMPEVRAVHRMTPKTVRNSSAAALTRTVDAWRSTGKLGAGIRIGVIDTGIDYKHADFGDTAFPGTKVVGGHDFAGDAYDGADPSSLPEPDADPMDCEGHGTHVAGTAAGYGVNADGTTYRGSYSSLPSLRIGPGTAPMASLYALKMFGCEGSTNLTAQALDWALDPNGDGDFSDHLDVVNLSLGSDFGAPDDPDSLFVRKLVRHGVIVVAAAGNGGDFYDVGGSPGNTREAISVANTRDAFALLDGVSVDGGQQPGQYSLGFTQPFDFELPVVPLKSNVDGCQPITEDVRGKLVWLEWDDNDSTRACGSGARTTNASNAGAAGVLLPSSKDAFPAAIAGNDKIPAFQFTATSTTAVRPALAAGTLKVRLNSAYKRSVPTVTPKLADTITPSSSRGSRGSLKPDLAAPGDTVLSAASGTGSEGISMGGTSMASPHVAGIAALLRETHPSWSVEEVKAALMNTASSVVRSGDDNTTGTREAPMRVGAGRVDALSALCSSVLAMSVDSPGAVGVTFGTVEVGGPLLTSRTVQLVNKGSSLVRLNASYEPITTVPGASFQLTLPYVVIPPGGKARVQVVLRVADPAALRKTPDPTVDLAHGRQFLAEASGLVKFTGDAALALPVYAAPKPTSRLKVVAGKVTGRGLAGDYRSRVTGLKLQGRSGELPSCGGDVHADCAVNATARGGDLRYAGATSTPDLLAFGVVTWRNWANLGSGTWPEVRFEVGGEQFRTRAVKPANANGEVLQDVWLARTTSADGEVVDEQPLNGFLGDVDTNLFDSNVVVLPVARSVIGDGPVTYTVGMGGQYTTPGDPDGLIDTISTPMTFNYELTVPSLSTMVDPGDPAPGGDLLLFHHNASGDRAQVR